MVTTTLALQLFCRVSLFRFPYPSLIQLCSYVFSFIRVICAFCVNKSIFSHSSILCRWILVIGLLFASGLCSPYFGFLDFVSFIYRAYSIELLNILFCKIYLATDLRDFKFFLYCIVWKLCATFFRNITVLILMACIPH